MKNSPNSREPKKCGQFISQINPPKHIGKVTGMKVVIRLSASEELKAIPILLRHSSGSILPDRTYVISEAAAKSLHKAGICFSELSRESNMPVLKGVAGCERI